MTTANRRSGLSLIQRLMRFNWLLLLLLSMVVCVGLVMQISAGDGDFGRYSRPQLIRFIIGLFLMIGIALLDMRILIWGAVPFYLLSFALLIGVEVAGEIGMGAQRWIDLGFIRLQPSELMKISLVVMLAWYYQRLSPEKVSRPLWVLVPLMLMLLPAALVLKQPDLGTAILLLAGGCTVMWLAGVSIWYFLAGAASVFGVIYTVFASRGTDWQLLRDYQFRRIDTFLDPTIDPMGASYHVTQSKIAFGSGGFAGKGFMEGPQAQLNFLPEKHTDFIFTVIAEEFGFVGSISLLALYMMILLVSLMGALRIKHQFGRLLSGGVAATFFYFFCINMLMVMGLAPVVGVPLPLVSYGGTSLMVLLVAFGLAINCQINRHIDLREGK